MATVDAIRNAAINNHSNRKMVVDLASTLAGNPAKLNLIPSMPVLKCRLSRKMKKDYKLPVAPKSVEEFASSIPPELKVTLDGKNFLVYNGGIVVEGKPQYACTFASPSGIQLLLQAKRLTIDGTFEVAPAGLYNQVYIVSAVSDDGRSCPVTWSLLTNKSKALYVAGLLEPLRTEMLKVSEISFSLPAKVVVMDYETAAKNAVKEVFPEWTTYGCEFHHKSAVRKHAGDLGLLHLINTDEHFAEIYLMAQAMVFAPPEQIPAFWTAWLAFAEDYNQQLGGEGGAWELWAGKISEFVNYYISTWVGSHNKAALFDPSHWSAFRSLLDRTIPTTSNNR
jgi:hypothetical protein